MESEEEIRREECTLLIGRKEEKIYVCTYRKRPNIERVLLPRWGKLHIDIFPQIVDDESLPIVREDGAHHIFVSVIFLPHEFSHIIGAFAV